MNYMKTDYQTLLYWLQNSVDEIEMITDHVDATEHEARSAIERLCIHKRDLRQAKKEQRKITRAIAIRDAAADAREVKRKLVAKLPRLPRPKVTIMWER